ncbi:MAG: ACP S-malonyltransferase, partial [Pseudomonadota bacterium]
REMILETMADINDRAGHSVGVSIELGGMIVLAGNEDGIAALLAALPVEDRFPLRLQNHAAFHTDLQAPVSERGLAAFPADVFQSPEIPLIDGRGEIWWPGAVDASALHQYTFGSQVTDIYDFRHAIEVGMREFAPECIILLGPGDTLGGAIAQSLIGMDWQGLSSKTEFVDRQTRAPLLYAMGRADQRMSVIQTKGPG